MSNVKITQIKGLVGCNEKQRRIMASLGLRKIQHAVVRADNPATRGQIRLVSHLVRVEEVD